MLIVDQGSILLIVYSASSAGMVQGIWSRLEPLGIAVLIGMCLVLLALGLFVVHLGAAALHLNRETGWRRCSVGQSRAWQPACR